MNTTISPNQQRERAEQMVERFVRQFQPSYRLLAYHAALPLVLTPELVNYLWVQFLRGQVPWVAEVDLLLSDLCRQVGYELYAMDTAVRAYLLEQMKQELGEERMQEVARLLISYVKYLHQNNPYISSKELQAQQWAAMVYLDEQREKAIGEITQAFKDAASANTGIAQGLVNRAEMARLAKITQELAPQLGAYENLVEYARIVTRVLTKSEDVESEALRRSYPIMSGLELSLPPELLPVTLVKKILILAANTRGDLKLDQEIREIREGLRRSANREQFTLETREAVRIKDLTSALLEVKPWIVHFCGQGSGSEGLVLENDKGQLQLVSTEALANLFPHFADEVECVLLNACYAEVQAQEIVKHLNYVIGIRQEIRDDAARAFTLGFYEALGSGESIESAYQFGCDRIQLEINRSTTSREGTLLGVTEPVKVPEHLIPVLLKRQTITRLEGFPPIQIFTFEVATIEEEPETLLDKLFEFEVALIEVNQSVLSSTDNLIEIVDEKVFERTEKHLNDVEQLVIQGTLANQTYKEMAALASYSEKHLRYTVAPKLWEVLSKVLGEKVIKRNLKNVLARLHLTIHRHRQQAQCFIEDLGNGVQLEMVSIPEGIFMMGSQEEEGYDSERPQHQVTVPTFYMGRYPITQAQWRIVAELEPIERELDPYPSNFKEDYEGIDRWTRPVEQVSWEDAQEFCDRLSKKTGREYRLPTEAEWEYACRAGTTTPFHFGETISTELANYYGKATYGEGVEGKDRGQTTPVGSFNVANAFGLYDMHGNVFEWCEDDWHDNYENAPTDGRAWLSGASSLKVIRGGSWAFNPIYCRSAYRLSNTRGYRSFYLGFRVVCVVPRTTK